MQDSFNFTIAVAIPNGLKFTVGLKQGGFGLVFISRVDKTADGFNITFDIVDNERIPPLDFLPLLRDCDAGFLPVFKGFIHLVGHDF